MKVEDDMDEQGSIASQKDIVDDPDLVFTPEQRKDLLALIQQHDNGSLPSHNINHITT